MLSSTRESSFSPSQGLPEPPVRKELRNQKLGLYRCANPGCRKDFTVQTRAVEASAPRTGNLTEPEIFFAFARVLHYIQK